MSAQQTLGPTIPSPRTAYDDPYSPTDLHADCEAADASLDLHAGRRHPRGAASMHFENVSRGVPSEAMILANAHKLAAALCLEED